MEPLNNMDDLKNSSETEDSLDIAAKSWNRIINAAKTVLFAYS